jgi:hypothetical protein
MNVRHVVTTLVLALGLSVVGTACGGFRDGTTATTVDARDETATLATNDFIPADVNLGDCVSSMPRPDCGSESHGGPHQLITFAVLMLGMAFIGWRIFRSVRRQERQAEQLAPAAPAERTTTAERTGGDGPTVS